jgi:hypothetical protein
MERLKRAVVKEEIFAITGDTLEALLLNQMLYWSERMYDFDDYIEEEKEIHKKYAQNESDMFNEDTVDMLKTCVWIFKKAAQLKDELMLSESEDTVRRRLKSLVDKGYLEQRNNPVIKYDRTMQYRVNLQKVTEDMFMSGYVLQGYKIDLISLYDLRSKPQNEDSKPHGADTIPQIADLKQQLADLKQQNADLKQQLAEAIPETTTKTTPDINTENKNTDPSVFTFPEWIASLERIKREVTSVCFNTWFAPILLGDSKYPDITLYVANDFTKGIVDGRYIEMIKTSIFETTGRQWNINVCAKS